MTTSKPKRTPKISKIMSMKKVAAMHKGGDFESNDDLTKKLFPHFTELSPTRKNSKIMSLREDCFGKHLNRCKPTNNAFLVALTTTRRSYLQNIPSRRAEGSVKN